MYGHNNYTKSSLCVSCFGGSDHHQALGDQSDDDKRRSPPGRCRNLIARISCRNRRRSGSADFSYDAMSYALNFESDAPAEGVSSPFRNFSDRLPASPPRTVEIGGCS